MNVVGKPASYRSSNGHLKSGGDVFLPAFCPSWMRAYPATIWPKCEHKGLHYDGVHPCPAQRSALDIEFLLFPCCIRYVYPLTLWSTVQPYYPSSALFSLTYLCRHFRKLLLELLSSYEAEAFLLLGPARCSGMPSRLSYWSNSSHADTV